MKTLTDLKNKKIIRFFTWYRVFNKIHKSGLWKPVVPIMILFGIYLNLMFLERVGDKVLFTAAVLYIA